MRGQRGRLALTMVWVVGALLFAFGRPALFDACASTTAPPPAVAVGVIQGGGPGLVGGGGRGGTDRLIRALQQDAAASDGAPAYNKLAAAYMQKGRESGDVTYYNLADAAVGHALDRGPGNFESLMVAAWVRLARHDFRGAAALARRSLRANAYHSETYGILGDAELEMGDYRGATRDYQRMVDLKPGLASYNRASHVHWLYADAPGALRIMRLAIAAGGAFAENVAWCRAQLGDDYFALGSPLAAEQEYRAALRTFPRDIYALAGLARLYAGQGRYDKAVALYKQAIAQTPLPQYVIALGDTYARMGQTGRARAQYALVDFIFHVYEVNHVNVGIDRALFYADHDRDLPTALRLARAEAATRHDVRTMDTLAWALYKNHDYPAALAAERQALRLGTRDASSYFHMGLIDNALGDGVGARAYLQGALMLNPLFDVRQAPVAVAALRRIETIRPTHRPTTSAPSAGTGVQVGVQPRP